jgi:hypothetical protein
MRRFIAMFAAFALVALMVTPVQAAKPNLTFTTHLTQQLVSPGGQLPWVQVRGDMNSGFTVVTSGQPGVQYELGTVRTNTKPGMADGRYPFYLKASPAQQATLTVYFAAKNWGVPEYYTQINAEIAGTLPFFWAMFPGAATLQDPFLADGFGGSAALDCTFWSSPYCIPPHMAFLMIDADYPVGSYTYEGTLTGTNGVSRTFDIVMTVVRG